MPLPSRTRVVVFLGLSLQLFFLPPNFHLNVLSPSHRTLAYTINRPLGFASLPDDGRGFRVLVLVGEVIVGERLSSRPKLRLHPTTTTSP